MGVEAIEDADPPMDSRCRHIAYLAHAELNAGEIAARFEMSKPAVSQHLAILEAASLVASEKRGQYVFYRFVPDNLTNTLHGFVQEVCPVSRPLKREAVARAKARHGDKAT